MPPPVQIAPEGLQLAGILLAVAILVAAIVLLTLVSDTRFGSRAVEVRFVTCPHRGVRTAVEFLPARAGRGRPAARILRCAVLAPGTRCAGDCLQAREDAAVAAHDNSPCGAGGRTT